MNSQVTYGERIQSMQWAAPLGIAIASGVDEAALQKVLSSMPNPVSNGSQTSTVLRRKGLPSGSALVKALLMAEMSTGLLIGAQDAAAIQDELVYDLAVDGESFKGMRGTVQCREGEIALRDAESVIASLFQGPDQRTRLTKATKNVIFFVFAVPGIDTEQIQEGIEMIRGIFKTPSSGFTAQTYERVMGREHTSITVPEIKC